MGKGRLFWILGSLLAVAMLTGAARAAVWENKAAWSPEWEKKYQAWVVSSWDKDFFNRPGPYQGIKVDCADAVYSMRYVFAAENGLPFAVLDPTGGKLLITNSMERWDTQSPSQRKRSFLTYLYGIISTHSIPNDTYPTAVSRAALGPGSVLRTDEKSHHSWTVKSWSETGIPFLVYSSRPARTTLLTRFEYPTTGFTFPMGLVPERKVGFMAFRQPADLRKPVWEVPGYSLEQYSIPLQKWAKTMQSRMKLIDETRDQEVTRMLDAICKSAQERVVAVTETLAFLAKIGTRCMTATEFDDHSTPSRDARLKGALEDLAALDQLIRDQNETLEPVIQSKLESVLRGKEAESFCPVEIAPSQVLTLFQVYEAFRADRMSWNPHDPREMRWGLVKGPSSHAMACPIY